MLPGFRLLAIRRQFLFPVLKARTPEKQLRYLGSYQTTITRNFAAGLVVARSAVAFTVSAGGIPGRVSGTNSNYALSGNAASGSMVIVMGGDDSDRSAKRIYGSLEGDAGEIENNYALSTMHIGETSSGNFAFTGAPATSTGHNTANGADVSPLLYTTAAFWRNLGFNPLSPPVGQEYASTAWNLEAASTRGHPVLRIFDGQ